MIIHIYIDVYKNTLARNPDSFMVMVLLSEDVILITKQRLATSRHTKTLVANKHSNL